MAGRSVVVTGAAGGIGHAVAEAFAQVGARVVAHHRPGHAGALPLLAATYPTIALREADLLNDHDVERLFARQERVRPGLDVLINCAGAYPVSSIADLSPRAFDEVVQINLTTTYSCLHQAALHMGSGGSIVNLASMNAARPMSGQAAYASAKAAVVALTRVAALELAPLGVRVNSVSPGLVDRPGLQESWPEGVARWVDHSPLRRLGRPEDIADACLFLASDRARWITGQDLTIDGGTSIASPY